MAQRFQTWPTNNLPKQQESKVQCHTIVERSGQDEYPLLVAGARREGTAHTSEPAERLEAFLRSIGLSFVYDRFRKGRGERPKVAIWRSRRVALGQLLLHVAPLGTIIVLLWLSISGYYLGSEITGLSGYNTAKVNSLQFAAKMHEITMLASLGTIVSTLVQRRAVSAKVAFGTIFASLQFSNVSYLWSKELLGMIQSEWRLPQGKMFITTIILAIGLAVSVGPSSAVLMIPRVDDWPAGGTDFWLNVTRERLWPLDITDSGVDAQCIVDDGVSTCPSAGWKTLLDGFFQASRHLSKQGASTTFVYPTGEVSLFGRFGFRAMHVETSPVVNVTLAACPTKTLADSLALSGMYWSWVSRCNPVRQYFGWRNYAKWQVAGAQLPVTNVACRNWNMTEGSPDSTDVELGFPVFDTYNTATTNGRPFRIANYTDPDLLGQVSKLLNSSHPELLWLQLDKSKFGNTSIGVVATFPPSARHNTSNVLSCEVDSHWLNVSYVMSNENKLGETWTVRPNMFYEEIENRTSIPSLPRMRISPTWAQKLNPRIMNSNQTVFEELAVSAGIWNSPQGPFDSETTKSVFVVAVEAAIASMITNGLSNLEPLVEIQGALPGNQSCTDSWIKPLMPQGSGSLGCGGMLWDVSGIDKTNMTKFTMTATANGYAYSSSGATATAAIVVLLMYSVMVLFHAVFLCWTGWSSSSWDTVPEIVTLALQSKPTAMLENTGAGVSSKHIFSSSVQIMDINQRVELVFEDTRGGGVPLKENQAYR